jgi:hypothetical protein
MSRVQITSTWRNFFVRLSFELIVIVGGILIALAISDWVSERQDRALEQEYLGRLIVDMQSNLEQAEFVSRYQQSIVKNARRIYLLIQHGTGLGEQPAAVIAYAYWASAIQSPTWIDATHQELLGSGRYVLLRNPDLRKALLEFDVQLGRDTQMFVLASTEYRNAIRSEFDPELQLAIRNECERFEDKCQISGFADEIDRLLKWMSGNEELAKFLRRVIPQSERAHRSFAAGLIIRTEELLEKLQSELEST